MQGKKCGSRGFKLDTVFVSLLGDKNMSSLKACFHFPADEDRGDLNW